MCTALGKLGNYTDILQCFVLKTICPFRCSSVYIHIYIQICIFCVYRPSLPCFGRLERSRFHPASSSPESPCRWPAFSAPQPDSCETTATTTTTTTTRKRLKRPSLRPYVFKRVVMRTCCFTSAFLKDFHHKRWLVSLCQQSCLQ